MPGTVIGEGLSIEGDVTSDEEIVVQGSVRGKLSTKDAVLVGSSAVVEANVSAQSLTIAGQVTGNVTALAFRNKGDILATAIGNHVQTWNAKSATLRKTFVRHGSAVQDVAFSPDGRWIASVASRKGAIWQVGDSDLDGNFLLFTALPRQEQSQVTSVAFAKDHTVVMGNADGKVLVYRCQFCGGLPQLRRLAKDKLAHLAAEAKQ